MAEIKTGLVLEGGAMRGMFTAGIMDVMLENGITFDGGIGVSAGATFGLNYKSKQIGRVIRYNKRFCRDWRYCSWRNLIFTKNLFNAHFCYHIIPFKLDVFDFKTYAENPMKFYIVCTDCHTGRAEYKELKNCYHDEMEWLRACASMPIAAQPVKIGENYYMDGGMTDSIPLKFMQDSGYKRNLVILTQPKKFVKTLTKAMPFIRMQLKKKFPAVIDVMEKRHIMYNEEKKYVFQQEKLGNTMVLCPDEPLKAKIIERNPIVLEECYKAGRKKGLEKLEEIKKFLSRN